MVDKNIAGTTGDEETIFSHRFSRFEREAVKKSKLMKKGEARVFVTSRYMETRELREFVYTFSIYETNANGEWGRITNGCLPPWEPSRGIIGEFIPTYSALKFVALHDEADIASVVEVLRQKK